jgi:hypothetical protein
MNQLFASGVVPNEGEDGCLLMPALGPRNAPRCSLVTCETLMISQKRRKS